MTAPAAVNGGWFRNVLSRYPTGVSVVSGFGAGGSPVGLAVGTFTSVSLAPPLVAFLANKESQSWPKIAPSGRFCVSILSEEQEDVCRVFATKEPDKFASVAWRPAPSGLPIIDGSVAWVDCDLSDVHDAGDHVIVVGAVRALDVESGAPPLLFFQGGYGGFSPRSMATSDAKLGQWFRAVDKARPEMERLSSLLTTRCTAAVLIDGYLAIVASAGATTDRTVDLVGSRTPAVPPLASTFLAFASPGDVDTWLARLDAPADRERFRRVLSDVRARGYSIGLHSPAHAEFERSWGTSSTPPSGAAHKELPYDPAGVSLEDWQQIRSLHAPVFDAEARVQLLLNLFLATRVDRGPDAVHVAAELLLDAADRVTQALGGQRPPVTRPAAR
jgi:flavin reductase (DIM6/NTAB) family NADH-FMN oxidoreductase RutF/DNA-binding IclR family transcriptional regulator